MEPWYSQTRTWSIQLTRLFSQTDTPGERDFAISLKELLSGNPYFQQHPDHLRLLRTQADPMERYVLMALVKGQGAQALVLTGHYDVVGIENYGELQAVACDPEALLPHLINVLQAEDASSRGLPSADRLALDDLLSGQYLPGRGMLDMKSGLAAGLSVLERFSRLPLQERRGSLLFIAVPDEEISSNGARTTGSLLPGLAREWGLEFAAAINLDASDVHGDGSRGQAVYLGSVGKLLPSVYLIGRETHAGSPFSGVNATLLASELTRLIECNPSFCERIDGFTSAPPTCLKQADTKSRYDVTTPTSTWCYYNWLTLRRPVGEILAAVRDLTHEALNAATASIRKYAGRFAGMSSLPLSLPDWQPQVYTFAEIKSLAMERDPGFKQQMDALEAQIAQDPALDTPSCCQRLTEAAWASSGLSGPAGVVGFASIYYAPVSLDVGQPRAERFRRIVTRQAEAVGKREHTSIALHPYFPGISDLSFLGSRVSPSEVEALAANTPAWHSRTCFEYAGLSGLDIPVVNIGPWGRDYHQRIERVFMPYAFQTLPELLWQIAMELMRSEGSDRRSPR